LTNMIKQSASYELRRLLYDTLTLDPTLTTRVYLDEHSNEVTANVWDTVPPKVKKPYVTIGKAAIKIDREAQTRDFYADLYMVEIDSFTHYGGKADVAQLQNDVMVALYTAWANKTLQFDAGSSFLVGLFEIDVRGEDVSVWGPKDAEHSVMTCNIQVIQIQ
jgi:hypothetical protein